METLLPSEVARLVLGYLEGEQCEQAAKCFLDTSQHLSEYRQMAQRGKRYPTKVNGYSLKEVLEEYCLVHSIVQESLTSMTDQPNVGGNMIECLRFLVRACQPVQVHINLHPQQGQVGASVTKAEASDISLSSRNRPKKIIPSEQTSDNFQGSSYSPSVLSQSLQDSSPAQICISSSKPNPFSALQSTNAQSTNLVAFHETQNFQPKANTNVNHELSKCSQIDTGVRNDNRTVGPLEEKALSSNSQARPQEPFLEENLNTYQELSPVTTQFIETPNANVKTSHGVLTSEVGSKDSLAVSPNLEFEVQTKQNSMNSIEMGRCEGDIVKPEEPVQSFTVTKCHGSNIVILDNSNPQTCPTSSIVMNVVSSQEEDTRKHQSKSLLTSPEKATVMEQISEKMIKNETLVSKLVENINRVWTPAKQPRNEDSQAVGENPQGLDEAVHSILKETEEDPCFDQFLREFLQFDGDKRQSSNESEEDSTDITKCSKKKRRLPKKKSQGNVSKLKHLCESAVSNLSVEKASSENNEFAASGATAATPAKASVEADTMTPMTKLLKSITSPSGDLYLDPTQFAGLLDMPGSAMKIQDSVAPSTSAASSQVHQPQSLSGSESSLNNVIQVSQPNGTTVSVPIVFCESNQQVAQYVNEKGVNTICEIQVMPHQGSYVPIMPKLQPGVPIPSACFGVNEAPPPKPKRRPRAKQVRTRGGRQAAGQMHPLPSDQSDSSDPKNTVTLYAAGKEDEVSSTISYPTCPDLPILVSDAADVPEAPDNMNLNIQENSREKNSQNEPCESRPLEAQLSGNAAESKNEIGVKEEDNNLPLLNSSTRNTPGLSRMERPNAKRISLSTPRRRFSHIRALDFKTPPKDGDQSLRRANTSPKNMSSNALSPQTSSKSSKSSVRGGLFKAPSDSSRGTSSKVKAHLFKSPEYLMNLSSGFKVPSTAVTSTPGEDSPVPQPSGAWDKIGGVSLILESESDLSPVKHSEPSCKRKVLKSWDADLRSCLGTSEPDPVPLRKRKAPPPPPSSQIKKGAKKCKKSQGRKSKSTPNQDKDKSQNTSSESAGEMAKILEQNLMEDSSVLETSPRKCSPSKTKPSCSPHKSPVDGNILVFESTRVDQQSTSKQCLSENLEGKSDQKQDDNPANDSSNGTQNSQEGGILASLKRSMNETENHGNPEDGLILIANAAMRIREGNRSNIVEDVKETSDVSNNSNEEKKTPLTDILAVSAVDKLRLQKASWAVSLSFETPMKDECVNVLPQTPHFTYPGSACKEETPRTKSIKTLPFPLLHSSENSVGTPIPSVPPTPSVRTTPPNCPPYFQPIQQSPSGPSQQIKSLSSVATGDSLENVLVKECSRIEASGMRETLKKYSRKSSEIKLGRPGCSSDIMVCEAEESVEEVDLTEKSSMSGGEMVSNADTQIKLKSAFKEKSSSPTNPVKDQDAESSGCARCQTYERKQRSDNNIMTSKEWFNNVKMKERYAGDETDECIIVSPDKKVPKSKNIIPQKASGLELKGIEQQPVSEGIISSLKPSLSLSPALPSEATNKDIEEMQPVSKDSSKIRPQPIISGSVQLSPEVLNTSHQAQAIPETSSAFAADDMPDDVEDLHRKTPVASPVKDAHPTLIGAASSEKVADVEEEEAIGSDDNETSSSSDDSSSDSDTDSTSSSSEDEPTPIKNAMSPVVPSSARRRNSCISGQHPPHNKSTETSQPMTTKDETLNVDQRKCTKDSVALANVELKSLLEAKSTNLMESLSKTNTSFKAVGFISELEQKRQRTLKQLKNPAHSRSVSKASKVKSAVLTARTMKTSMSSSGSNNISTIKVANNSTKDTVVTEELPKKNCSPPESIATGNMQQLHQQQPMSEPGKLKSSLDGGKASDEEEFQLHLSGDEKEVSPKSSELDSIEMQLAVIHQDDSKYENTPPAPTLVNSLPKQLKAEDKSSTCMESEPALKLPGTKKVSSKAADAVIKTLMEKGFGCTLPRPPTDKIKKLACMTESKPNSGEKSETSSTQRKKQSLSENPQASLNTKPNDKSSRSDADMLDYEIEDETEIINSSMSNNSLDIRIFYKGVGCLKPRGDTVVLKRQRMFLDGTEVCLSPSPLIELYSKTCKVQLEDPNAVSHKIPKSSDIRPENWSIRSNPHRRADSLNEGETQSRHSWNRNSGDRASRRHDECRSKRNQSPSPRGRSNPNFGDAYSHSRHSHRNQDYHHLSRRDSYPRRRESNFTYSSRGSDSKSRSAGPTNQRSKISEKGELEDGELTSSDSELETKRSKSIEAPANLLKSKESKTVAERNLKKTTPVSTSRGSHTSRKMFQHQNNQHRNLLKANPSHEREDYKNKGAAKRKAEKLERPLKVKCADEDVNDADLDSENFPVLGEDDANGDDSKDSDQNSSPETNPNSKLPLRRAPPRQVNAHKLPSESKTPTQKGKRKLSTSPDVVSEDSCQSSLGSVTTDSKSARSHRRSKKISSELAPVTKILKLNEGKGAVERDIIKDLNVDKFLDKIHPPKSPKHS